MADPALIPVALPDILKAIEQRLLTYTSPITDDTVAGDISNIYWVFPGDEPAPGTTGQRDILLALSDSKPENVEGDGRFSLYHTTVSVYLRSTFAADRRGTYKDWMTAHLLLVSALMDSLMLFFPEDGNGNALTNYGLILDDEEAPKKTQEVQTWGQSIGVYRFHYLPLIDETLLIP